MRWYSLVKVEELDRVTCPEKRGSKLMSILVAEKVKAIHSIHLAVVLALSAMQPFWAGVVVQFTLPGDCVYRKTRGRNLTSEQSGMITAISSHS